MAGNYLTFLACLVLLSLYIQCSNTQRHRIPTVSPNMKTLDRNPLYDFATNLYLSVSKLKNSNENMLISPFSIRTISALIYLAAKGETAEEIRRALLFPAQHDALIEGLAKQMASTRIANQSKFDVGNGIFLNEGVSLNKTYSNLIRNQLRSEIQLVPFRDAEAATKQINDWVARITRDKIMKIVNPFSFSPTTSVFIANALYFSGQWDKPFPETETIPGRFTLSSGRTVSVAMMQIENTFSYNYIKELEASAISLPFKDSRFEFIVLKPDGNIGQLERKLREYQMNLLSAEVRKQTRSVFLQMPKFRLNVHYDLVEVMNGLGIKALFDSEKADVSGLTQTGVRQVVSKMVHHTVLDINERGAAGAAVSTVSAYPISSPSQFTLDKPFMFVLNDKLTGPVFIGRMENPTRSTFDTTL